MISSWGNYLKPHNVIEKPVFWQDQKNCFETLPVLPFGNGRSYGDVCFLDNGIALTTRQLSRFIYFDEEKGILTCEAGCLLGDILKIIVSRGWILPVLPGTQFVTVGGAIANDVHGKNHHRRGTFGCHVLSFVLQRSSGEDYVCSPAENTELFAATIGGLGLTGLIVQATLKLIPIQSAYLSVKTTPFYSLSEFFSLSRIAEKTNEYTVAWLDCQSGEKNFLRGLLISANHISNAVSIPAMHHIKRMNIPCFAPSFLLNKYSIQIFNSLYFYSGTQKINEQYMYYQPFFFPLDAINHWNRLYGKRGFLQYQCVVPFENIDAMTEILHQIVQSGQGSFLSVLKTFSTQMSSGLLSFPMAGVTLALDFPYRGVSTLSLLNRLDEIVMHAKGRVYPAKDARMSKDTFFSCFGNQLEKWKIYKDSGFLSNFWMRVMHEK